jgi:flagellar protein FlbD
MIKITRLDGSELVVNANMIETVEATPDTVINLISEKKIVVKESPEEIVARTVKYLKSAGMPRIVTAPEELKKKDV